MKHTRIALLAAAALWWLPAAGLAQESEEVLDADAPAAEGEGDGAAPADAPAEGGEEFNDAEFEEGGEGVGDICEIDPAACPTLDMAKEAAKPLGETIKAVQQRFIIKKHRFELQPFWGITLNDQFVGHPGPGLAANFYITEVMAVGINGQYYDPFNNESAFNAQVRRAARVGVPLTEYQWAAAANFSYMPASGKFAGFGNFIFHYDMYVVGGIGAISTRPIAVIDPDYRNFSYQPHVDFNVGLGLKIFFNRWFAAVLEVRDYIFIDQLENLVVPADPADRADPDTWLGDTSLTNNVQAQLGVSVFIPFSFKYRLPKAGADTAGGAK
jgi:outer membrane beta-barrel protein